jgi:4-oxalomesaconate tautomerase
MGSPDPRQIDGIGGADPLTSKVAVLAPSSRADADVDYLFLQVFVDQALVSDAQGCGNILAGVGPAAIERGLVPASDPVTPVRIHMVNTGEVAVAEIATPGGRVSYRGDARIDGVPGHHAAVPLMFQGIAGSMCGALLPTGRAVDVIEGVEATLIDNGMPCVVMRAADFGLTGAESREALEENAPLKARIEAIRLAAGPMMALGDVAPKSVPKMTLVSPPRAGGTIATRSFIPHRVHATVGVFAAVTVATACTLPGSPAATVARLPRTAASASSTPPAPWRSSSSATPPAPSPAPASSDRPQADGRPRLPGPARRLTPGGEAQRGTSRARPRGGAEAPARGGGRALVVLAHDRG